MATIIVEIREKSYVDPKMPTVLSETHEFDMNEYHDDLIDMAMDIGERLVRKSFEDQKIPYVNSADFWSRHWVDFCVV